MSREPTKAILTRRETLSWAFYDWANSAFVTTVVAGFFPVFFKQYWSAGSDVTASTFKLGLANSFAGATVALLAPLLGAIADSGNRRKRFLAFFAALGVGMTGGLYFVAQGQWQVAVALYVLANIGFSGGNIFYDALMLNVAPPHRREWVSALGYAFGYLGGGLLFACNVLMTLFPGAFGLANAASAVRVSFLTVALWWAIFAIPLFLFVREDQVSSPQRWYRLATAGFGQIRRTFGKIRQLRMVFLFLLGYWCYIDGVDTVVRMAVDYGMSLGFASQNLIVALLITQFVGFPSAIAFGKLGQRVGPRPGIFLGLAVYAGVTLWGVFMQSVWEFFALAIAIGLVQGGVQALSRSLYARMIPPSQSAEFFGFYNMLGKFASVLGPLLMGWVGVLTHNPRASILAILALLLAGGFLLSRVDVEEGERRAQVLESANPTL